MLQTASTEGVGRESTGCSVQDPLLIGTSLPESLVSGMGPQNPSNGIMEQHHSPDGVSEALQPNPPFCSISGLEPRIRNSAVTGSNPNNIAQVKRYVPPSPPEKKDTKPAAKARTPRTAASLLPRPHTPSRTPAPASPLLTKVRTAPKLENGRLGSASKSATPQTLARKNVATFGNKGVVKNKGGATGPVTAGRVRMTPAVVRHKSDKVPPDVETRGQSAKDTNARDAQAGKTRNEVPRRDDVAGRGVSVVSQGKEPLRVVKRANFGSLARGSTRNGSLDPTYATSGIAIKPLHPTKSANHANTSSGPSAKPASIAQPQALSNSTNSKDPIPTISSDRVLSTSNSKGSTQRPPGASLFAPTASSLARAQKRDVTKPVKS
jgi:hypothetical protein